MKIEKRPNPAPILVLPYSDVGLPDFAEYKYADAAKFIANESIRPVFCSSTPLVRTFTRVYLSSNHVPYLKLLVSSYVLNRLQSGYASYDGTASC
uniref:Peptidase_S15 domain-containing protein n=1 Tax=Steinernema glaseri TaxID=37863 RepID=A0A1I7ZJG3_9BILA